MTRRLVMLGVLVLGLAGGLGFAQTNDGPKLDPLLELLVKKGVITEAEATALQAEAAAKEAPVAPAPAPTEPAAQPAPVPAAAPAAVELPAALKGLKIGTTAYLSYQDGSANDSSGAGLGLQQVRAQAGLHRHPQGRRTLPRLPHHPGHLPRQQRQHQRPHEVPARRLHRRTSSASSASRTSSSAWRTCRGSTSRRTSTASGCRTRCSWSATASSTRPTSACSCAGNFGEELPKEYRERVNPGQAGRWGSFAVGLYNGGGYNASEKNSNKVLEGRVSLRPLPDIVPGLQVSAFGISGKGNIEETATVDAPDWEVLAGMISYESPRLVVTGQYEQGTGNQRGTAVNASGVALDHDGYSFFTELRLDEAQKYSLFGRYDRFDPNTEDPAADVTEADDPRLRVAVHQEQLLGPRLRPARAQRGRPRHRGPGPADPPDQVLTRS